MNRYLLIATALLAPVLASAQASGTVAPPAAAGGGSGGAGGFNTAAETTKNINLRLVEGPKDGVIIATDKNGQRQTVKLDKKYKIKAEKGTEFAGQKHIAPESLQPGMLLRVSYRTSDSVAFEIKILKDQQKG